MNLAPTRILESFQIINRIKVLYNIASLDKLLLIVLVLLLKGTLMQYDNV